MDRGIEGAEILNELLFNVYDPVIKIIYSYGGFILYFEGDGFIAAFKSAENNPSLKVLKSVAEISDHIERQGSIKSKFYDFEVFFKICISSGLIEWDIFKCNKLYYSYFRGQGIENVTALTKDLKKGDIVIDGINFVHFQDHILKYRKIKKNTDYRRILSISNLNIQPDNKNICDISDEELKLFYDKSILGFAQGEFRDITSIFITFEESTEIQTVMEKIIHNQIKSGGSPPRISIGDKGVIVLLFFGTPLSYENNEERAISFILNTKKDLEGIAGIRAGISSGMSFTGFYGSDIRSEFSCLGVTVNLAARLMQIAGPDEIYLCSETRRRILYNYDCIYVSSEKLKGIKKPVSFFRLNKPVKTKFSEDEFFTGRKKELDLLKGCIVPGNFKRTVVLSGNMGIGKTALIRQFEKRTGSDLKWIHFRLNESLDPLHCVKNFLVHHFSLSGPDSKQQAAIFSKNFNMLVRSVKKPLLRARLKMARPFIAFLLNISQKNDILSTLSRADLYESLNDGLKNLFCSMASEKPLVISIDNLLHLNDDLIQLINMLIKEEDCPILIIFSIRNPQECSYVASILSKERANDPKIKHIKLGPVYKSDSKLILKEVLLRHVPKETNDYIFQKTKGNPLFLIEMAEYLMSNDLLDSGLNIKYPEMQLPGTIQSIIISQIDRFSQGLKDTVKIASIFGHDFEHGTFARVISLYGRGSMDFISEALNQGIFKQVSASVYSFCSDLLRECAYQIQLKKEQRILHRFAADTYIEQGYRDIGPLCLNIAKHLELAGDIKEAADYYKKASQYLIKRASLQEALRCDKKALNILHMINAPIENICMTVYDIIKSMDIMDMYKDITDIYNKYSNHISRTMDHDFKCKIAIDVSNAHNMSGNSTLALKVIDHAISLAKAHNNVLLERLYNWKGYLFMFQNKLSEAMKCFDKTSLETQRINPNIGLIYMSWNELKKAEYHFNNYKKAAIKSKDKRRIAISSLLLGDVCLMQNDLSKAEKWAKEACIFFKGPYFRYYKIKLNRLLSRIYMQNYDYKKSELYMKKCLKDSEEINYTEGKIDSNLQIAFFYMIKRNYKKAEHNIHTAEKLSKSAGYTLQYHEAIIAELFLYVLKNKYYDCIKVCNRIIRIFKGHPSIKTADDLQNFKKLIKRIYRDTKHLTETISQKDAENIISCELKIMAKLLIYKNYSSKHAERDRFIIHSKEAIKDKCEMIYHVVLSFV